MALQYLNQYLEIVGPEHESYPTCLAYKADDLWHFGAHDSAIHYAYKALEAPHTPQDRIEYICHHVLWNIYESREMPDSAHRHKALHMHIRDSRAFEPMSMEELKSQLETDILASTKDTGNGVPVWIAVAGENFTSSKKLTFIGSRKLNIDRFSSNALNFLRCELLQRKKNQ